MSAAENMRQKTKKPENTFLKNYVGDLEDEHLRFLDMRLKQRLSDDLAEAVVFLSKDNEMDSHLSDCKGAEEFYDTLDAIQKQVEREVRRRHG